MQNDWNVLKEENVLKGTAMYHKYRHHERKDADNLIIWLRQSVDEKKCIYLVDGRFTPFKTLMCTSTLI